MELLNNYHLSPNDTELPFIEANTVPLDYIELQRNHIIPVFKDNTVLISQHQFIESTFNAVSSIHKNDIVGPFIRVSHPIKGRIPSAKHKKITELEPHEETLYYERMMFVFLIPSITRIIDGQELKLVIGGVKAYNKDNLYKNGNALQSFTFFIGFQVKVCSNLSVWSDGTNGSILVNRIEDLSHSIFGTLSSYNPDQQLNHLESLQNHYLNEAQFAHFVGKCRMSNYLPKDRKSSIIPSGLNETQLSIVTKNYFNNPSFSANNGLINLWSLYNLFTEAAKTSYIDNVIDNHVAISSFFGHIAGSLENNRNSWYLTP